MKKTLRYTKENSNKEGCILIDQIVRLSENEMSEACFTWIHLKDGSVIASRDPISLLEKRIEEE